MTLFNKCKAVVTITVYRLCVDVAVIVYTVFGPISIKKNINKPIKVYMTLCHRDVYVGLLSALSLNFFLNKLEFFFINDGSLTNFDCFLTGKIGKNISPLRSLQKATASYPFIAKYVALNEFSSKKFFTPFLTNKKTGKVIILDSDSLFFNFPKQVYQWIESDKKQCLFMKDYESFSILSRREITCLTNKKWTSFKLNSGLLCIDLDLFYTFNKPLFKKVETYVAKAIKIAKERMTYDYITKNDFKYISPLIEQTLFALTLNACKARPLSSKYMVMPFHSINMMPISEPACIHYTGEGPEKRLLYKYLFGSLVERLFYKKSVLKPWYIFSKSYCWKCRHL